MALTNFTDDVNIISKLDDYPPDDSGMTTARLKGLFDTGSGLIKTFINGTLLLELNTVLDEKLSAATLTEGIESALAEAKASGEFDGSEIELQNSGTYIQWRYSGDNTWTNLVTLEDLKGAKGDTGATGGIGPDGSQGKTGAQGKSVEYVWNGTQLGIRIEGDVSYTYVDLKGATGATGAPGTTGNTGAVGATGRGISSVVLTDGDHAAGTTDTYTITFTDSTTMTFGVYNGANGFGAGDMLKNTYDTNNSGVVDNAEKVNGLTVLTAVPSGAVFTDTTYSIATTSIAGLESAADKTKLDGITAGATANSTDTVLLSRANHTGTQLTSTISDFAAAVRGTVITGLSTATNAVIAATDTVLVALGKLQAQITANLTALTNHTGNTSNPHSTTAAQVGAAASSHSQAASTITAGTLAGQVTANATAESTVTTAQIRDIYAGATDMTAGTTALTTGVIYLYYV